MILPVSPVTAGGFLWHRRFWPASKAPAAAFVLLIQFDSWNMFGPVGFF
jgi:hypothetical protein